MSSINESWEKIFEKYNIERSIRRNGCFYITADEIREFKEPRLMTKFDTRESLPTVFGNKLAILPVTRGKYVIGEFDLYKDFPETAVGIKKLTGVRIPDYYETIDINNISSEANAINVMGIAGILDDFLSQEGMVQTVSGRMGSGVFSFEVETLDRKNRHTIHVQNSQVEIDGGFENQNIFSIIEGKNVVHSNFLIRQLYYPTRLWQNKIQKQIRPVFMIYSNNVFRLLEYRFSDPNNYSSIELVQERNYSLEDVDITINDLVRVFKETNIEDEPNVTFIQADSFNKVISLVENLKDNPMSTQEIAELFAFKLRQSDYYYNACKYLGLAEKKREEGNTLVYITELGTDLLKMKYKDRQLAYVSLILRHRIFHDLFEMVLNVGEVPDKNFVIRKMKELQVCSDNLLDRRSSSVRMWLYWILNLINVE
ncbi:MAG: hypothetical protein E7225_07790 [Clostridiales bacterium]|nr:hypothetical protein [Clostridiales bacterium]